jgi:hypothetical protein
VSAHEAQTCLVQRHAHGDAALVVEVPHDATVDAGEVDMADMWHLPPPHPHSHEQPHHQLSCHQAVPQTMAEAMIVHHGQ